MKKEILDRRTFIKLMTVGALYSNIPFLPLSKPANAFEPITLIQGMSLVISLVGSYMNKGDGLNAMLSSLKEIGELNISLSQNILQEVGNIQASLQGMPEEIRRAMIEVNEYKIREIASTIQNNLNFVKNEIQENKRSIKDKVIKNNLNECIQWGSSITGAQDVPYGVGPIGALCVPIIAASVAKAHHLLGQGQYVRGEMKSKYLPWLEKIRSEEQHLSLQNLLYEQIKFLENVEKNAPNLISTRLRERLGKNLNIIIDLEPKQNLKIENIACLTYFTDEEKWTEPDPDFDFDIHGRPRHQHGRQYIEKTPSLNTQQSLSIEISNDYSNPQPSPASLKLDYKWQTQSKNPIKCDEYHSSSTHDTEKIRRLLTDKEAKSWEKDINVFQTNVLDPITFRRQMIWAYNGILNGTKEAENRMRGVFKL